MDPETYEVYAVKYGTMQDRPRHTNFIMADPHEGNMPIDYYVWAIVNARRTLVVDTGFNHAEATRRGRSLMRLPREGRELGQQIQTQSPVKGRLREMFLKINGNAMNQTQAGTGFLPVRLMKSLKNIKSEVWFVGQ